MKKATNRMALVLPLLMCAAQAFAQYGVGSGGGQIDNFLNQAIYWTTKGLGSALLTFGIAQWAISMFSGAGNEDTFRRGFFVIFGGGVLFAAPSLVSLLRSWAGGF